MEFPDPIESCPYNIMHRIRRSRMQFHVITCAQNHKHAGMLQCPFDARHVIKRMDFEHHKNTCPARELVLDYAIHDTASQAQLKILPIDVDPVGRWDEKWDEGADVKTYDPIKNIKNKPIVYPLIGVSRAKRKNHRLQERIRYNNVIENREISMSESSFYPKSMQKSSKLSRTIEVVYEIGDSKNEQEHKPLRPPIKFLAAPPTVCTDSETSSTLSKVDESANNSFDSVSVSSNQRKEDSCILKKSSRTINTTLVDKKDQKKDSIPDTISIVSTQDKYQYNPYQYKDQGKSSKSDAISIVSSMDEYQFIPYQHKDKDTSPNPDAISIASSRDEYQFVPYQHKDEDTSPNPDAISIASSRDEYQFIPYQYKEQDQSPNPDSVSVVSSRDDYQFYSYQYEDEEKPLNPDSASVISSRDDYQFYSYPYEDQEKSLIPNTVSITFAKDKYQVSVHKGSEESLSSSSGETSEIDEVFIVVEDDSAIHTLPETIETVAENDKGNNNFPITDTVYDISISDNESQYAMTPVNWNPDILILSSEVNDTSSESLSYETAQSSWASINSTKTKSVGDVSAFEKLSKPLKGIVINGKDHQKKSESLNQEIDMSKKLPSNKTSRKSSITVDINNGKLFPRCAANFLNLK